MTSAREQMARLEAGYASLPPRRRLEMASELLEWTVANFATPIADGTVRDLISRASASVRKAVTGAEAVATAEAGFFNEMDEAIQTAEEEGASELLLSYWLCFDQLAPEITPQRLVVIFDHCRNADSTRSDVEYEDGMYGDEAVLRAQEIRDYQSALKRRYADRYSNPDQGIS